MKQLFFGFNILAATLVQFDTQDNIYREAFECNWVPQIGSIEDDGSRYMVQRIDHNGQSALRVFSIDKIKAIRLNKFPFSHKIKRVSPYEFLVTSKYFEKYWNDTDWVEVAIIHY